MRWRAGRRVRNVSTVPGQSPGRVRAPGSRASPGLTGILTEGKRPARGGRGRRRRQFCCGSYQLARPSCSRCGGGLGGLGAADHVGRGVPGLVLEVRRAARQDLVGRADRRLAGLAPGDELLRQRVLERDRLVRQREEARQRVGVERGELRRADPFEEGPRGLGVRRGGVQPDRDVDVVGDVAGVALVRAPAAGRRPSRRRPRSGRGTARSPRSRPGRSRRGRG